MAQLRVELFGGIQPRLHRRLGRTSRALVAENTKLWHGSVAPWRQPKEVAAATGSCVRALFVHECCIVTDESPCAKFATGIGPCKRIFATGLCEFEYPVTAALPTCCSLEVVQPDWVRLGVPRPGEPLAFIVPPLEAPANIPTMGWQLKRETRDYVYTYVNQFGEEGSPSEPSPDLGDADTDAPATITIPSRPGPEWGIVAVRVYRLISGNLSGDWPEEDPPYLFVEEIDLTGIPAANEIVFVDDVRVDELGEAAPASCLHPPVECLQGIIELESGALAGFDGKDLWFSEPFKYHAFSCSVTLDDTIRGIVEVDHVIYVATDGPPYTVSSRPPDEECFCCRSVYKHKEPAPMVSDLRGIVATANGAIYPSNDGLVRLTGNGMTLITHQDFAEDDWKHFHPDTMIGANLDGRYFGFSRSGGLIVDYTDSIYADGDVGAGSRNTTLTYQPDAVFVDQKGYLYLSFGESVRMWDAAAEFERYTWQSKLFQSQSLVQWTAARLLFNDLGAIPSSTNPVTLTFFDGQREFSTVKVINEQPFRVKLPRMRAISMRVSGTSEVTAIVLGTSMRDLAVGASATEAD